MNEVVFDEDLGQFKYENDGGHVERTWPEVLPGKAIVFLVI